MFETQRKGKQGSFWVIRKLKRLGRGEEKSAPQKTLPKAKDKSGVDRKT